MKPINKNYITLKSPWTLRIVPGKPYEGWILVIEGVKAEETL